MWTTKQCGIYPEFLGNDGEIAELAAERPEAEEINVIGFGLRSLEGLKRFRRLRKLAIHGQYHCGSNPKYQDTICYFSALPQLFELQELLIHDCYHFDNIAIAHAARCTGLRALTMRSFMQSVTDFTPLRSLPNLALLDLSRYAIDYDRNIIRRIFRTRWCDKLERQADFIRQQLPNCTVILPRVLS